VPVTLKDIAERVGKSVPTVSRALANFPDIAADTREEIKRVAQEMGYVPNITARHLQKQRTDTVSLILPVANHLRISDPFFSEFLTGVVETTTQSNFSLILTSSNKENEQEAYLRLMRNSQVDGFIVMRTQQQDSRIDPLRAQSVPFVAFGRTTVDNDFPYIDNDDELGIRLVVDHLVELGHTRLGFIAEPVLFTKSYNRMQGYRHGLQAHGLAYEPDLVVEASFRQPSGKVSTEKLLSLPDPPTAIIACNDLLALGAMSAVQESGLKVGRDISITGYDDILLAEYATPPLTTVHQPGYQLGIQLTELLIKIIRGEIVDEQHIIYTPSLVIRDSTAPRRSTDPMQAGRE
jgi:DNA-binding LacI/PurR family transcriptional regulator